ncbi:dihydrofolate reductase family protein [Streptomyces sp. AS02]|uniref:dihydrofolate reductase family protein n=1 Tax=Streptomyces sp. AS02 TaxID=2938946 RepID=UPI002020E2A1|nr:dihydrofolate reductase family protein [Streptomyces sp. AS02]MCL8012101.1 dihydrofolate reductase family protein [Streptomyces sp. AS02]
MAELKRRPGREPQIHGSAGLAQSLLTAGLIDTLRLVIAPGRGGPGPTTVPRRRRTGRPSARKPSDDTGRLSVHVFPPAADRSLKVTRGDHPDDSPREGARVVVRWMWPRKYRTAQAKETTACSDSRRRSAASRSTTSGGPVSSTARPSASRWRRPARAT